MILNGQRTGRAGDAALEELAKELEARRAARHHTEQHQEQRDDLADSEEHREGGALGHQSKVKR